MHACVGFSAVTKFSCKRLVNALLVSQGLMSVVVSISTSILLCSGSAVFTAPLLLTEHVDGYAA